MKKYFKHLIGRIPFLKKYIAFKKRYNEPNAISFKKFLIFNLVPIQFLHLFYRKEEYLPIDRYSTILRGNVFVGKCSRIQRSGCYIQGRGKVFIGDYVGIASNVAIISANHDLYNHDEAVLKETIIGDYSWIATNSCIMAGVVLGPRTIVGAGSVVTKSFPNGFCVIAGNPAKIIKELDSEKVVMCRDSYEFYGYLPKDRFQKYFRHYYQKLKFDFDIKSVSKNELFA